MRFVVWMAAWQIQCCDSPFEVGSKISWTLDHEPDKAGVSTTFGAGVAERITHFEEHHGGLPDGLPPTEGTVRTITGAFCRYTPSIRHRKEKVLLPVPGSVVLRAVTKATGREPKSPDLRFNGYIVELDVPHDAPDGMPGQSRRQ